MRATPLACAGNVSTWADSNHVHDTVHSPAERIVGRRKAVVSNVDPGVADVCFASHSGLKSDIASCPLCAVVSTGRRNTLS